MTDPDTFPSNVQYNYDFGAVTRTQDPKGAAVTRTYDAAGRIERETNEVNGAYTRYVYAPDQSYLQSFTTINDLNPANEFYSITVFDGHGRVKGRRQTIRPVWASTKRRYYVYDMMGRLARQTNPTEINRQLGNRLEMTTPRDGCGAINHMIGKDARRSLPTRMEQQRRSSTAGADAPGGKWW